MTEARREALVPVPTYLKGPTFVALERLAERHGTSVAVEVAIAADARAEGAAATRGRYVRVTDEIRERIAQLYADGVTPAAIAKQVGCSRASVYVHLPKERP